MHELKELLSTLAKDNFKDFNEYKAFVESMLSEPILSQLKSLPDSDEKAQYLNSIEKIKQSLTSTKELYDKLPAVFIKVNAALLHTYTQEYFSKEELFGQNFISRELKNQTWYIDRIKALYPKHKADDEGMCFGMAAMCMQAFLIKGMETCSYRLQEINNHPISHFENDFQLLREKKIHLIQEGKEIEARKIDDFILNTRAFFDGVVIAFNPARNAELFNSNSKLRQDLDLSMPLTLSTRFDEKSKPELIENLIGSYNDEDLLFYLDSLQSYIDNDLSLILGCNGHAINLNLSYDPETGQKTWLLLDPNNLPAKKFDANTETRALAKWVKSYYTESDDGIVMHSRLYANVENNLKMQASLNKLKENKEFLKMHDGSNASKSYGDTSPIYYAIRAHQLSYLKKAVENLPREEVTQFLEQVIRTVHIDDESSEKFEYKPFYYAYLIQDPEILSFLIDSGIKVPKEKLNEYAVTTSSSGPASVFEVLLYAGAEPSNEMLKLSCISNQAGIVKILLEKEISPSNDLLSLCCLQGAADAAEELISSGIIPTEDILTLAVERGQVEIALLFLKNKTKFDPTVIICLIDKSKLSVKERNDFMYKFTQSANYKTLLSESSKEQLSLWFIRQFFLGKIKETFLETRIKNSIKCPLRLNTLNKSEIHNDLQDLKHFSFSESTQLKTFKDDLPSCLLDTKVIKSLFNNQTNKKIEAELLQTTLSPHQRLETVAKRLSAMSEHLERISKGFYKGKGHVQNEESLNKLRAKLENERERLEALEAQKSAISVDDQKEQIERLNCDVSNSRSLLQKMDRTNRFDLSEPLNNKEHAFIEALQKDADFSHGDLEQCVEFDDFLAAATANYRLHDGKISDTTLNKMRNSQLERDKVFSAYEESQVYVTTTYEDLDCKLSVMKTYLKLESHEHPEHEEKLTGYIADLEAIEGQIGPESSLAQQEEVFKRFSKLSLEITANTDIDSGSIKKGLTEASIKFQQVKTKLINSENDNRNEDGLRNK